MDEQLTVELIPAKSRRGFQPGHKKFGGRRRGSVGIRNSNARLACEKLKMDPAEWLLRAAQTGILKNGDGTETRLSPEARINAARAVLPYVYARRSHVSGTVDHNLQVPPQNNLEHVMRNPELAAMADKLAFAMLDSPDDGSPVFEADFEAIRG